MHTKLGLIKFRNARTVVSVGEDNDLEQFTVQAHSPVPLFRRALYSPPPPVLEGPGSPHNHR
ncbi:hypothetical protein Scep_020923 [Stephania cephalantha]|uniref:Uncharacterized protein n=1 Tax=Stephania cephalantha TaxID=152367 RepID=A0AAP0FBP5_9MAGN